ncbi:MAG: HAD family hydrolase [Rhodospirillaceae bacterium]|nr:HAD family hydrolase [Rhodospirillaceae bacterium]
MPAAIGFDGDDTLWHNETIFSMTQDRFRDLMVRYVPETEVDDRLIARERANLRLFGYGVKGFMLSMIETAIEVTGERISAGDIQRIIDFGKTMLDHPVELLDGVEETIDRLARRFPLYLITKGDLFDQESKIARSGLAERFQRIEIVSEKDEATYAQVLERAGIAPGDFLMVGNSVRSDILPVLAIGGRAVHIPYHITWAHEVVPMPDPQPGLTVLDSIRDLPGHLPD